MWSAALDGEFGPPPETFVVLGNANLDPNDGDGLREAMQSFLSDPRLQDSRPDSIGGALAASPGHLGDPALDTADWAETGPGNLRVSYVLPSANLRIVDAGVVWPDPASDPDLDEAVRAAGPHRLVWVDIAR